MLSINSLRDQVALASNPSTLRAPAFMFIDKMQDMESVTPGERILALAVALCAITETCDLDLTALISKARLMLQHAEGPFTHQLQAVRDFARSELLKGGR